MLLVSFQGVQSDAAPGLEGSRKPVLHPTRKALAVGALSSCFHRLGRKDGGGGGEGAVLQAL